MKKTILILTALVFLLLVSTIVSAEVYEDNYARYGTIDPNGVLTTTNTPINNANFIGFVCSSNRCGTVSSRLWPGVLTSSNDYLKLTYPTTLQSQYGYAVIVYKDGYIPFGINPTWAGNGVAPGGPFYDYLTKKEICGPHVNVLTVTNNCKTINVVTTVRAPISKAGIIDYYPQEIAPQFTSNVDVTLEVRKDNQLVYTETKKISLFFSEEKDVSFSYNTPTSGTYNVKIISTTDESRCLTHASDSKNQDIAIPACCSNTDCGTNGLSDNPFCQSNNVFQNFITYTCVNPGQSNSYCTNSSCAQLKQDCDTDSCSAYGAYYCKGNAVYKSRTCTDKGCSDGACYTNTRTEEVLVEQCSNSCSNGQCTLVVNCTQNSDCGANGFIDNPLCNGNKLFQNFITYTCVNPNTPQSYCINSTCNQLKQDCGTDSCTEFGQNYCKDNNLYKSRTCTDNSCSNAACYSTNSTDEVLVENCSNGCSGNQCNPPVNIICSNNTQCGTDGWIGNPLCQNGNVFKNYISYTCNNPATPQSYCSNSTANKLFQTCVNGCSNGNCIGHHTTTGPCDNPDNLNCQVEQQPQQEQQPLITINPGVSSLNKTTEKIEIKTIKCSSYFCNTNWLWLLIIMLLLLLIILIIAFILWLLGSRKRKNIKRK